MKANTERIRKWVSELTHEQLTALAVTLTEELMACEVVRFWDDFLAPYWEQTGEPLVEGQKTSGDD